MNGVWLIPSGCDPPFIKKYQPTVGFSLKEAALAEQVTIIGGRRASRKHFGTPARIRCIVDRIAEMAQVLTQLSER
jgi:hypothetical protein